MQHEEQQFGATPIGYVWALAILGTLSGAMAWKAAFHDDSFWQPAALFAGILVLTLIWLKAFRIRITADAREFRSLWGVTRIRHSDIR